MLIQKGEVEALKEEIRELRATIKVLYKVLVALTLATKEYIPTLHSTKKRNEVRRRITFAKKSLLEMKETMTKGVDNEKGLV